MNLLQHVFVQFDSVNFIHLPWSDEGGPQRVPSPAGCGLQVHVIFLSGVCLYIV